ncbi:uncharacterized protein C2845_PM03G01890 [Panicum miliaceum]|uniref:Helicase SEN1-like n=1 Tax=Panicum miliaceum TaxID=4540 RepID=A0A3L6TAP9_PANMI|nr:uncharacterized protein C2845_PM03G01890 [Panicum miliaceum]
MAAERRLELAERWRGIQEDEEAEDGGEPSAARHRRLIGAKEEWCLTAYGVSRAPHFDFCNVADRYAGRFSHCYTFLVNLPKEEHIWCGYADIMGPFLETFHGFFDDEDENSSLRIIWRRVSQEMGICTQCVCEHHQAQGFFDTEYRSDTVDPLLKVLRLLDEERVTEHLIQINKKIQLKEYDPSCHGAEVVSIMFEVLMYPVLLDDQSLANQFQMFIETIDESYELSLSTNQQYPGVYALLFFKTGKAQAIGLRLARSMAKLRRAVDLEPLQPLMQKYINFLEAEVLPSTSEHSRPRVQLKRADIWLGFKSLLGFLEAPAFEDGVLEKYPVFLNIVRSHVSDDTSDLSCAVRCLKASFEMLVIYMQSLEALQDGEHEKQRRNILYFLLYQVTRSSNFSTLMRKNATKIALLIVQRGYTMSPPCPPTECAHMWGPSLISSIEDTSLHSSLRQPALGLIYIIIISDASALISYKLKYEAVKKDNVSNPVMFADDDDELPFSHDAEEKSQSCWNDFSVLNKLASRECKDLKCIPLLWYLTMVQLEPSNRYQTVSDAVDIDELEDRISNFKLALSKEAPATVKRGGLIDAPMFKEPIVSVSSPVLGRHTGMDSVVNVESTKPFRSPDIHEIILLSDSEDNSPAADVSNEEVLSSVMDNDAPTASNMSKEIKPPEPSMLINDRHVPLKPQICSTASNFSASRPVSTDSRGNIATSKGLDGMKKPRLPKNANDNSLLPKSVKSSVSGTSQPQRPNLSSDTEKFKSIFRDISDDEDDPLDHALESCRRPQIPSSKPSILVPKRQVVQLPVPVGRRQGSGSKPLVLEEFKAQLQNSNVETPPDDMMCGCISILSVERVDEFLIVRARPENSQSIKFKGCMENDLILLTKDPLKNPEQQVHVLGKVEGRESDKNKALFFVIKFFLFSNNARLNKVKRLLVERSKWFLNRVMSMTPQIREFSALSSLNDIPVLPAILNPVSCAASYHKSGKVHLDRLAHPLREVLKSSYNESQLQAVSIAIGSTSSKTNFDLSLIQGPPGTGKTRTIVAIVSALLSLHADNPYKLPRNESVNSTDCTKPRAKIIQSAAVTRAWQDAALAKQLEKDSRTECPGTSERFAKGRALICAQSNAAVDELVSRLSEGLYGADGKMYRPYIVRVGNAKTVHSNSLPFFIDTLVEQRLSDELKTNNDGKNSSDAESSSSLRANLEKIVDRIRHYESRAKLIESDKMALLYLMEMRKISAELATAHAREKKIADENKFLKHKVRKSILREAEIIVTTLSGCGGDIHGVCSETASSNKYGTFSEHALFDVVVIDEAAQALEPATLIPLQLLKSRGTKCIMVGDPKQLPATVMSGLASKFLYECSMFERLQRAGYPVIMLTKQYRMHPEISRFPSLHFYENKLLDGAEMAEKSASFHDHDYLGPYMFFDIADGREHCGKNAATQSLCNESEADAALAILTYLKKRLTSFFGPEIVAAMEINTVDGFQGREVDILVLSTVRASNSSDYTHRTGEARSIGFVADVRRMNVALTRARLSLWIVGNARTLRTNSHWDSLVQNAEERNLFISIKRPYGLMFEKIQPHSRDIHGTTRSYHTSHLNQKDNRKAAMISSKRIDARLQEQSTHAVKNVEKEAQESIVRSSEDRSEKQNDNIRSTKSSRQENIDQDSVMRNQMEGKKLTVNNVNHLELSKGLVKGGSHEGSSVRRQMELNIPVEQNVCKKTNKASSNQDFQNPKVTHNSYKKNASRNKDMGTIKGSLKHDLNLKSASKKDDVSPPSVSDLQKLIQNAKGARKFSEKPRCDNPNQVDLSVNHDGILDPANKNDGACPPTIPGIKRANKAKRTRRFSEHPRPQSSTQGVVLSTVHSKQCQPFIGALLCVWREIAGVIQDFVGGKRLAISFVAPCKRDYLQIKSRIPVRHQVARTPASVTTTQSGRLLGELSVLLTCAISHRYYHLYNRYAGRDNTSRGWAPRHIYAQLGFS